MNLAVYRIVTQDENGELVQTDYKDLASLLEEYHQIGTEEDSYTIRLHGEPLLRGLVGPLSEGKNIVRYESPEVFAQMTEQWSKERRKRRSK